MKPRTIKVVQAVGRRSCLLALGYYDSGIIPEGEPVLEIDAGRGDKKSYISMAGLRIARDFLQNNIPPILETWSGITHSLTCGLNWCTGLGQGPCSYKYHMRSNHHKLRFRHMRNWGGGHNRARRNNVACRWQIETATERMGCIITGNNLMNGERYIHLDINYLTRNRRISLNGMNLGIQALSNYSVKCSWYPNCVLFPGWCN